MRVSQAKSPTPLQACKKAWVAVSICPHRRHADNAIREEELPAVALDAVAREDRARAVWGSELRARASNMRFDIGLKNTSNTWRKKPWELAVRLRLINLRNAIHDYCVILTIILWKRNGILRLQDILNYCEVCWKNSAMGIICCKLFREATLRCCGMSFVDLRILRISSKSRWETSVANMLKK